MLESLALEKLNQAVESLKEEGFAWVQVRTQFDYSDLAEFGRARTVRREPTEEEQARIDALTAEMEAIEAEYEAYDEDTDESGEVYAQLEEKHDRIQWELDTLSESLEQFYPDGLAIAGAIVTIGYDGQLKIERGLVRKEDMKKLSSEQEERAGDMGGTGKSREEKPVHSEKLTRMLTAHRIAAIQAAMADRPEVALAVLVHRLAMQVFGNRHRSSRIVQINVEETHLKIDAAGQEGEELFACLLDQSQQDLLELLAVCTAASINTVSGRENTPPKEVAALMTALNLDMADWWEATPENYLSHVSKDRILSVVTEAVSPEKADAMRSLKKEQLVLRADEELSGRHWLPDNFKVKDNR